MSAVRAICYYLKYTLKNGLKFETDISHVLAKCINHSSTEVKHLAVQSVLYLSLSNVKPLDLVLVKLFIPMLVNGTREKAPAVRSTSELALVSLLHLNKPDSIYNVGLRNK